MNMKEKAQELRDEFNKPENADYMNIIYDKNDIVIAEYRDPHYGGYRYQSSCHWTNRCVEIHERGSSSSRRLGIGRESPEISGSSGGTISCNAVDLAKSMRLIYEFAEKRLIELSLAYKEEDTEFKENA